MSEATSNFEPGFLIKLALGVVSAVLSAAIVASFALLLSMSGRLTVIETIIAESKEERRDQIQELREVDRELIDRVRGLERVTHGRERSP
jgi:ABC-type transport system involved in cytochrome bd biosynthesis fused ATPase/permease subunit